MSALADTDYRIRKAKIATNRRMGGAARMVSVTLAGAERAESPNGVIHAVGLLSNEADCGVRVSRRARPKRVMLRGWRLVHSNRCISCSRCTS